MLNKEDFKHFCEQIKIKQKIRNDVLDCSMGLFPMFVQTLHKYHNDYNTINLIECCEFTIEHTGGKKGYSETVIKNSLKLLLQFLFENHLIDKLVINEVVGAVNWKAITLKTFIINKCFFHLDELLDYIKNIVKQIGNNEEDSLMIICWCVLHWYFADKDLSKIKKSDCNDKKHLVACSGIIKCIPTKYYHYIQQYKSLVCYHSLSTSDKKITRTIQKSKYLFRTDKCSRLTNQTLNSAIRNFNNIVKLLPSYNKVLNFHGVRDSMYYYTIYSHESVEGIISAENFVKHYQRLLADEGIIISTPTFYTLKQGYPIWKKYIKQ